MKAITIPVRAKIKGGKAHGASFPVGELEIKYQHSKPLSLFYVAGFIFIQAFKALVRIDGA